MDIPEETIVASSDMDSNAAMSPYVLPGFKKVMVKEMWTDSFTNVSACSSPVIPVMMPFSKFKDRPLIDRENTLDGSDTMSQTSEILVNLSALCQPSQTEIPSITDGMCDTKSVHDLQPQSNSKFSEQGAIAPNNQCADDNEQEPQNTHDSHTQLTIHNVVRESSDSPNNQDLKEMDQIDCVDNDISLNQQHDSDERHSRHLLFNLGEDSANAVQDTRDDHTYYVNPKFQGNFLGLSSNFRQQFQGDTAACSEKKNELSDDQHDHDDVCQHFAENPEEMGHNQNLSDNAIPGSSTGPGKTLNGTEYQQTSQTDLFEESDQGGFGSELSQSQSLLKDQNKFPSATGDMMESQTGSSPIFSRKILPCKNMDEKADDADGGDAKIITDSQETVDIPMVHGTSARDMQDRNVTVTNSQNVGSKDFDEQMKSPDNPTQKTDRNSRQSENSIQQTPDDTIVKIYGASPDLELADENNAIHDQDSKTFYEKDQIDQVLHGDVVPARILRSSIQKSSPQSQLTRKSTMSGEQFTGRKRRGKRKSNRRCDKCEACKTKVDCGKCDFCKGLKSRAETETCESGDDTDPDSDSSRDENSDSSRNASPSSKKHEAEISIIMRLEKQISRAEKISSHHSSRSKGNLARILRNVKRVLVHLHNTHSMQLKEIKTNLTSENLQKSDKAKWLKRARLLKDRQHRLVQIFKKHRNLTTILKNWVPSHQEKPTGTPVNITSDTNRQIGRGFNSHQSLVVTGGRHKNQSSTRGNDLDLTETAGVGAGSDSDSVIVLYEPGANEESENMVVISDDENDKHTEDDDNTEFSISKRKKTEDRDTFLQNVQDHLDEVRRKSEKDPSSTPSKPQSVVSTNKTSSWKPPLKQAEQSAPHYNASTRITVVSPMSNVKNQTLKSPANAKLICRNSSNGSSQRSGPTPGSSQKSGPALTSSQRSGPAVTSSQRSGPSLTSSQRSGPTLGSSQKSGPTHTSSQRSASSQRNSPALHSRQDNSVALCGIQNNSSVVHFNRKRSPIIVGNQQNASTVISNRQPGLSSSQNSGPDHPAYNVDKTTNQTVGFNQIIQSVTTHPCVDSDKNGAVYHVNQRESPITGLGQSGESMTIYKQSDANNRKNNWTPDSNQKNVSVVGSNQIFSHVSLLKNKPLEAIPIASSDEESVIEILDVCQANSLPVGLNLSNPKVKGKAIKATSQFMSPNPSQRMMPRWTQNLPPAPNTPPTAPSTPEAMPVPRLEGFHHNPFSNLQLQAVGPVPNQVQSQSVPEPINTSQSCRPVPSNIQAQSMQSVVRISKGHPQNGSVEPARVISSGSQQRPNTQILIGDAKQPLLGSVPRPPVPNLGWNVNRLQVSEPIHGQTGHTNWQALSGSQMPLTGPGITALKPRLSCDVNRQPSYPSLLELIKAALIQPGDNVLSLHTPEKTYFASLLPTGLIQSSGGEIFRTPVRWCCALSPNNSLQSIKKSIAYNKIFYKGMPLSSFKLPVYQLIIPDVNCGPNTTANCNAIQGIQTTTQQQQPENVSQMTETIHASAPNPVDSVKDFFQSCATVSLVLDAELINYGSLLPDEFWSCQDGKHLVFPDEIVCAVDAW